MAGDIVAFFGLNDKDFQRGLTKAAAAAGSLSAKVKMASGDIQKSFGKAAVGVQNIGMASFAAVGTAVALAGKAVSDYGEINSQVKGDIAAMGNMSSKMWQDIGRDIAGSIGMIKEWAGTIITSMEKARKAVVDFVAKGLSKIGLGSGDEPGAVFDAMMGIETQDAEIWAGSVIKKMKGELAAAGGDDLDAKLQAIEDERQKKADDLNKALALGGPRAATTTKSRNEMFALIDATAKQKSDALIDERLMQGAAELDRQDAERRKAIDEQARISDAELERERAQSNAQILLGFETRRLEVDTLRQNGEQREADLLEARLDAYQRIYEINHQTMIDEQDKASAIDAINRNLAARESTIMQGDQAVRGVTGSLGVGFGGIRGLASQVFGGEAGDSAKKQVKLQERMVRVLESIERKTGAGLAVFAP